MMKSNLYEFTAILKHETEKAILVDCGEAEPIWIPKSLCEWNDNPDGKTITVVLEQHIAEDKGIV